MHFLFSFIYLVGCVKFIGHTTRNDCTCSIHPTLHVDCSIEMGRKKKQLGRDVDVNEEGRRRLHVIYRFVRYFGAVFYFYWRNSSKQLRVREDAQRARRSSIIKHVGIPQLRKTCFPIFRLQFRLFVSPITFRSVRLLHENLHFSSCFLFVYRFFLFFYFIYFAVLK